MYSRLDYAELAVRRFNKGENRAVYRSIEDIPVLFTKANQNMNCQWDAPKYVINGKTYDWDELHHMCYSEEPQEYEFFRIYNEKNSDNNYTFNAVKMLVSIPGYLDSDVLAKSCKAKWEKDKTTENFVFFIFSFVL